MWLRLAKTCIAVFVLLAVGTSGALAAHVFNDVPDGAFYAVPAEWAADKAITLGCGNDNFCPNRAVTRGESITFTHRYDQNVVQPALAALPRIYFASLNTTEDSATMSSGVVAVGKNDGANGSYFVTIDQPIANCVATGTLADLSFVGDLAGSVTISQRGTDTDTILVRTINDSGFYANQPFAVHLFCN